METPQPVTFETISGNAIIEVQTEILGQTEVRAGSWVRARSKVVATRVGERCFIGFGTSISFSRIADGAMLASRACIEGTPEHPVHIGKNAWLGTTATVYPGISIGDGAIVAAGALVTEDVPADTIVVGRPAQILKKRALIEDGIQDPTPILERVKLRARAGLPSFLNEMSLSPEHAMDENGLRHWHIADTTLVDSELSGGQDITIGGSCILIGRSTKTGGISTNGGIYLADKVQIDESVLLEAAGGLFIGDRCVIGKGVTIVTSTHDHQRRSLPWMEAPVRVDADVTIGERAVVIGPATIGTGAVIEPYSVVIGNVRPGEKTTGIVSLDHLNTQIQWRI